VASRLDGDQGNGVTTQASWCNTRYDAHLSAGTVHPSWLHEFCDDSPTTNTKPSFPVSKLFQPTISTINGETCIPDIAQVPIVPSREYSAAEVGAASSGEHRHTVADRFISLPHMSDVVPFTQQLELHEAAPFLWHGVSPFWSPLVLTYFVLEPLRSAATYSEQEVRLMPQLALSISLQFDTDNITYCFMNR